MSKDVLVLVLSLATICLGFVTMFVATGSWQARDQSSTIDVETLWPPDVPFPGDSEFLMDHTLCIYHDAKGHVVREWRPNDGGTAVSIGIDPHRPVQSVSRTVTLYTVDDHPDAQGGYYTNQTETTDSLEVIRYDSINGPSYRGTVKTH